MKKSLNFGLILIIALTIFAACAKREDGRKAWTGVKTFAGFNREFGEPFGLAFKGENLYVSDGENGKILRVTKDGAVETVTDKLNTPSGIAFDKEGFLIVADAGSQTIKRVNTETGEVTTLAGQENQKGDADGTAEQSLFNAPVGVAIAENKVFVADTYNDKIRVIENGRVTTVAGNAQGFSDAETGADAQFDTPCGVAVMSDGNLIVADTGNKRLRLVEAGGRTTTLGGNGEAEMIDGLLPDAKFVQPVAVAVDRFGAIYVADGNAIRAVGRRFFSFVEIIAGSGRGLADGNFYAAKLNRPSGLALDENGTLFVADSENQLVRIVTGAETGAAITGEQIVKLRYAPEEFRALQPARWTYNPPDARRDIAGTLGEIRGELTREKDAWFHNGLDIAGGYGETARFARSEKVTHPLAAEGFGGLRERLRMPTVGYIHIRLGRDAKEKIYEDARFQFSRDDSGKLNGVRVPRGAKFEAGESIGTLNSFNHVHLVAGRVGAEMNALDALRFPNISDKIPPTIEKVRLFDENWSEIETGAGDARIKLNGKTRVVVRAFDQMDGGAAYRKLGVYRLGYRVLKADETPVIDLKETISFARFPAENHVRFVYAPGSQSGYAPQTIFDYIVTNEVNGDGARENFFDAAQLENGAYILRVIAADYFGNNSESDIRIEIAR